MTDEFTCSTSADELLGARDRLRVGLETAGVHRSITRDLLLGFGELTTPRSTTAVDDSAADGKVSVGLTIGDDEVRIRVHSSTAIMSSAHESGEQDLMLHVLVDRVDRVVDQDGTVAVTLAKRRVGR